MAGTVVGAPSSELTKSTLTDFEKSFRSDPKNIAAMSAVTNAPLSKVAVDWDAVTKVDRSFSHHLTEQKATSQKHSGRCWLFAALNTFRVRCVAKMNLNEEWELSQAYMCFFDKLEKSNYFLTNVLATLDEPVGSRVLDHLLADPIQDGGQWHMFVNLVKKYGVVPKTIMPETDSSSNTGAMNAQITGRLREFAWKLRSAHENGSSMAELEKMQSDQMAQVYKMLCIHLGVPPKEFEWQWRDKDRNFTRAGNMTPQKFFETYVELDLDDMVCLIHDPRPMHEYNRLYTVKFLGNVVGGDPIAYVNVDLDTMKKAAIKQIKDNEPVWFGCDVGKYLHRDHGTMDLDLFNYDVLYGSDIELPKAERLMYRQSMMTHAMVFTGVNLDGNDQPDRWRVENSWSDEAGDKGYFLMTDRWFDEYNLEVVVHKKYVPESVAAVLDQDPVVLDPWDPMGSLAL